MKYKQSLKGFTLIEILVVIVLMSILGLILTNILSQVLRGQNKINIVSLVKQNGQVVLDKLSNEIRSAEKVICIGKTSTDLADTTIVLFRNGNYTRIRFVAGGTTYSPGLPAVKFNGYFKREDFTKDYFADSVTDQMLCTEYLIDRGQKSFLTDQDSVNGISIDYDNSKPIFAKQLQAGFPDLVLIRFKGSQGMNAGKTPESAVAGGGVLFTTAAAVRGEK